MTPGRIWAACLGIIAAAIVLPHPELYLWTCIGAGFIGAGAWIVHLTIQRDEAVVEAWDERFKRASADRKAETLRDTLMAADQENAILSGRLADVAEVPHLRIVPPQHDGREPWPPVARAVKAETTPVHDGLAVETFMEQVEAWGADLDG